MAEHADRGPQHVQRHRPFRQRFQEADQGLRQPPGRGDALRGEEKVLEALEFTQDFLDSTYRPVAEVAARGGTLKEAFEACRRVCDPKFGDIPIYEHCLPFNVARAYDEALEIDTPRVWTAERDREVWAALQE
jgi:hypothetical protein